jgi:NAD(P)-dependent dehydrogenase (short-subunit alcohol dehydrogenase family)
MYSEFKGRVVFITGGTSGIGRATALAFARTGAKVAVAGRRSVEGQSVVAEIKDAGGTADFVETDVAQAESVRRAVEFTIERFGDLHAAFNNAGTEGEFAPIVESSPEDFDQMITVNLRGVWLAIKYELEALRRLGHGGAIVNTSSWLAHGAFAASASYSASKAGLDGMIRALALEGADLGVRINNVNPGIIDTPMLRRFGSDDAIFAPFVKHTPAGRLGRPEDIANAVLWLCSDGAEFVTGQNLLVDGGFTIPGFRWG